jgi:uncharacterized membrane protein YraQ (UPF0718 family)
MDGSTIAMAVLLVALFGVAWKVGEGNHLRGLRLGFDHLVVNLPRVFCALLTAGFIGEILPRDVIASWLGHEAGVTGIAIAAAVGAIMPGGPIIAFPIVVALAKAGAAFPALVTFLTAWSILGLQRVFAFELPMMGPKFVLNRLAVAFILVPISGGLAYLVSLIP